MGLMSRNQPTQIQSVCLLLKPPQVRKWTKSFKNKVNLDLSCQYIDNLIYMQ